MQQLASHGLFNVMVEAEGDTWIDDHHTNEDIGGLSFHFQSHGILMVHSLQLHFFSTSNCTWHLSWNEA